MARTDGSTQAHLTSPPASDHPDRPSRTDGESRPSEADSASRFAGQRIHCVGIGGCGVSGLALMLRALGARCSGSDHTPGPFTRRVEAAGISVEFDQSGGLDEDVDLVVASAAIKPDHPELLAAQDRGIPILGYAEALGKLQAERTGVCIAGTHGKSTTAAMLCHVLVEAGLDPSFIIGAACPQIGGGSRTGAGVVPRNGPYAGRPGLLVAEACEFNRSFHHHRPMLALINNVEEDHLDVYGSIDGVVEAFARFAQLVPGSDQGGHLVIAHEGAHRREITAGLECAISTFGFSPSADYQVVTDPTVQRVGLLQDGVWLAQWTNTMPGEHMAMNAAAAAIIAHLLGVDWTDIARALECFAGLERRLQRLGSRSVRGGEVAVYDDYGHHPTEIEKTLRALKAAVKPERLVCVFQPHQHSRTRFLLEEFAQSFSAADLVIVPHIYFVRDSEIERQKVSACDLVDRLRKRGVAAMHVYPFDAITEQLEAIARPGDLVVIMGAGPVWQIGHDYLARGEGAEPLIEVKREAVRRMTSAATENAPSSCEAEGKTGARRA